MVIQSIEQAKELEEVAENTQVIQVPDPSQINYYEVLAPAEVSTSRPEQVHRDRLLIRLGRLLLAFYDWLSAPPMSDQDRTQHKIAEAKLYLRGHYL